MQPQTNYRRPPDSVVEVLDNLDIPALRAMQAYVAERLNDLRPSLPEPIRSEVEDEPVEVIDRGTYTRVRRNWPTPDSTEDVSQPLSCSRCGEEISHDEGGETVSQPPTAHLIVPAANEEAAPATSDAEGS